MKTSELRNFGIKELNAELTALLREKFNLRMQQASKQLVKTHTIKIVRKKIARLQTIMKEKAGRVS